MAYRTLLPLRCFWPSPQASVRQIASTFGAGGGMHKEENAALLTFPEFCPLPALMICVHSRDRRRIASSFKRIRFWTVPQFSGKIRIFSLDFRSEWSVV